MSIRKTFIVSLLSNVLVVTVLLGAFAWTQRAQANTPGAPAGPLIGPFFYSVTSFEFKSPDDVQFSFSHGNCGIYRTSPSPALAVAPLHLPTGAQLSELLIDTCDPGTGSVTVSIQTCDTGRGACDDRGTVTSLDGVGHTGATIPLAYTVDNTNRALIVLATFNGGDAGAIGLWFVRVAYYVPASTFLPLIRR